MAEFVNADFTVGSNILLSAYSGGVYGSTWPVITGHTSLSISSVSDNVFFNGTGGNRASGSPVTAEYDVEADIIFLSTVAGSIGVCARCSNSAATFYHPRYNASVGDWQLYKVVGGSFSLLDSFTQTLSPDTVYNIRFECYNGTDGKKVFIDDVERMSSSNNDITDAGFSGIRYFTSTTNGRVDNFKATDKVIQDTLLPTIMNQNGNLQTLSGGLL